MYSFLSMAVEMTYHTDTSRISKSGLDLINKSPLHYWDKYLNPERVEKSTPALEFGQAFHRAISHPIEFENEYAVFTADRRTNAGKAEYAALIESAKKIISQDDSNTIKGMQTALMRYPRLVDAIKHGEHERTFVWDDPATGAPCKMRVDCLHDGYVFDWKSIEEATPSNFRYSAKKYRYHVQDAFYIDGLAANGIECKGFIFVAVEKSAPFGVGIYELPAEAIAEGREAYIRNLNTYMECRKTGKWTGYTPQLIQW